MRKALISVGIIAALGFIALLALLAHAGGMPLLSPVGSIGQSERALMARTTLLMLIVAVPVYVLIAAISWRYRAGNKAAVYTPEWKHSTLEEFIWWAIPFEIVLVLSAITWTSTHALAPERKIQGAEQPLVVQVVALPWKWVFIYPEQGVASVNELALPVGRPVTFQITANAPMNSFWIPALGGQEYAMSGMVTTLNLIADKPGDYPGMSANYSGEGFAGMRFMAHALPPAGFNAWIAGTANADAPFDHAVFQKLATPAVPGAIHQYSPVTYSFSDIVHASMGMQAASGTEPRTHGGDMPMQ